jgi:PIN domain nuclease of toxin-antitoxin system
LLLLDTCAFLWLVGQQQHLSETAKLILSKNSGSLFISAISAFEIGLKTQKGLLDLPMPVILWWRKATELHGINALSIDCDVAICATQLSNLHRDPADRIIIATAMVHKLKIITPDRHIKSYSDIETVW